MIVPESLIEVLIIPFIWVFLSVTQYLCIICTCSAYRFTWSINGSKKETYFCDRSLLIGSIQRLQGTCLINQHGSHSSCIIYYLSIINRFMISKQCIKENGSITIDSRGLSRSFSLYGVARHPSFQPLSLQQDGSWQAVLTGRGYCLDSATRLRFILILRSRGRTLSTHG